MHLWRVMKMRMRQCRHLALWKEVGSASCLLHSHSAILLCFSSWWLCCLMSLRFLILWLRNVLFFRRRFFSGWDKFFSSLRQLHCRNNRHAFSNTRTKHILLYDRSINSQMQQWSGCERVWRWFAIFCFCVCFLCFCALVDVDSNARPVYFTLIPLCIDSFFSLILNSFIASKPFTRSLWHFSVLRSSLILHNTVGSTKYASSLSAVVPYKVIGCDVKRQATSQVLTLDYGKVCMHAHMSCRLDYWFQLLVVDEMIVVVALALSSLAIEIKPL